MLDDTDLTAPCLLTGIPRLASGEMAAQEQRIAKDWQRQFAGQISEQPRLLSLRRANVAGLGLANVNPADCRFTNAHNLDKLRLEADIAFGLSPARAGWERRQVVAEESEWRAKDKPCGRWTAPPWPEWAGGEKQAELNPGAIAGLYRAHCAKVGRTPKTNPALPTSTTARWKCAATTEGKATPTGAGPGTGSLVSC